jgi:CheY-like chemotaxis protein
MRDAATTCLLVEDDFVLRSHTIERLRAMGVVDVAAFAGEADALEYLAGTRPGFAILDYRLGRMETGERVAAALLALSVPMVIATGLGLLPDDAEGLGEVPVLAKPFREEDIRTFLVDAGLIGGG